MDSLSVIQALAQRIAGWTDTQTEGYGVGKRAERVPEVSELRSELKSIGIKELKYFSEGLDCIQYAQAPRAAIVLGWTGFIYLLQERIARDNFTSLNAIMKTDFHGIHKRSGNIKSIDELAKHFDDSQLLLVGRKLNFFTPHVFKQLDAMRDERNNCAHVEEYAVTVRIALGFYAKLLTFLPYVI